MFTLCRRALSSANRYASILQSVAATATVTRLQPTFIRNCSYEGDGKTKAKVLNIDMDLGLMINAYSESGFRLNTDMKVIGPMAIFPRMIFVWNVDSIEDVDEHSLSLFCVMEPKLDILVIGTGDAEVTPQLVQRIKAITKKYKLTVEVLKTEAAIATFNFLNAESRVVAAALIPPKKLKFNDMDLMLNEARHKQLYGTDPLLENHQNEQIVPKT